MSRHPANRPGRCRIDGVMSIVFPWNRTATSPSTQRISNFVTRMTTRVRAVPAGSAFVLSRVRVLVWIRSGQFAADAGVGR